MGEPVVYKPKAEMSHVYLVYYGSYSNRALLGVYATMGLAKVAAAGYRHAPWSRHEHTFERTGSPLVETEATWSCPGFDELKGHHLQCELEIEERVLVTSEPR